MRPILLLLALCVAAATADRTLSWSACKGVENYCCVTESEFCLGGKKMACAPGTHCVTQKNNKSSPCVTRSSPGNPDHGTRDCGDGPCPDDWTPVKPVEHKPSCPKNCDCTYRGGSCHKANYNCVDGSHFCLAGKTMRCAKGTRCSTWAYKAHGISPCIWA